MTIHDSLGAQQEPELKSDLYVTKRINDEEVLVKDFKGNPILDSESDNYFAFEDKIFNKENEISFISSLNLEECQFLLEQTDLLKNPEIERLCEAL